MTQIGPLTGAPSISDGRRAASPGITELTEERALGVEPPWLKRCYRLAREAAREVTRCLKRVRPATCRPPEPALDFTENCIAPPTKRVLLSYVSGPFRQTPEERRAAGHANVTQAVEIARAWNRLGYAVDVIDWQDKNFVPARRYDAFMGQMENFARLLPSFGPDTLKVYYATRCTGISRPRRSPRGKPPSRNDAA